MSSLLMLSPAPIHQIDPGEVVLDVKFVEGMKLHAQLWPGKVRCVLWRGATSINEPMRYALNQLGFELIILDADAPVPALLLEEATMVYCAADDMKHLDLPAAMRGKIGRLVYTVDQSLSGRVTEALHRHAPLRRRLGSALWNVRHEKALRGALSEADAIHCNGYPSARAYRRTNARQLTYLDNRLRTPLCVRSAEQDARAERLLSGAPLRMAWFGTMSADSGVMDLVQAAFLLKNRGLAFNLEVYGAGPEVNRFEDGIRALGLGDRVSVAPPTGFEPRIIPHLRRSVDLFLSPHALATPLGTYVEAMGCGLPIVGYENPMWRMTQEASQGGWLVRNRSVGAMVRKIEQLHDRRAQIVIASQNAADFARANSFETVFARRMADLRELTGVND